MRSSIHQRYSEYRNKEFLCLPLYWTSALKVKRRGKNRNGNKYSFIKLTSPAQKITELIIIFYFYYSVYRLFSLCPSKYSLLCTHFSQLCFYFIKQSWIISFEISCGEFDEFVFISSLVSNCVLSTRILVSGIKKNHLGPNLGSREAGEGHSSDYLLFKKITLLFWTPHFLSSVMLGLRRHVKIFISDRYGNLTRWKPLHRTTHQLKF